MVVNTLKYNVLGLRMGTVAGWAPKIRMETLFNSLNYNAYHNALINITNASNFRAILYIDDLMHFLINELDINLTQETTSQLPLSSWSGSIGTLGCEVANYWRVPIHFGKDDGTYSFQSPSLRIRLAMFHETSIFDISGMPPQEEGW